MNETKKTGIFWGVAVVVALIAAVIAWPTAPREEGEGEGIGGLLFSDFKDPLAAASLKIVTFDEAQGELKNFEVRKDSESGLWTIPSKSGYPADAIEQMRDAANALVGLDILDIPTSSPEDHAGMGVVEPKLEDLSPGDEGVGRLVTFKDNAQKVLASVIIGQKVKEQEGQVYVRIPGQDPVYVVKLDDKPLSTQFQDWIEEDLLQLSSIDIENVEIKDYNATLGIDPRTMKPGFNLTRNYTAKLAKENSNWSLDSLTEYDNSGTSTVEKNVEISADQKLAAQKLNDLANALDDLKFVDVNRKPDGISANLKADKDVVTDNESFTELAGRGFIPIKQGTEGEIELMSANGEVTATTKDGVKYILRFGNISGITEGGDEAEDEQPEPAGGVNRYLMVSTVVDDSKFPVPDLQPIPNTLEDLDALDKPAPPPGVVLPPELNTPEAPADDSAEMKEEPAEAASEPAAPETAEPETPEPESPEPETSEPESTEPAPAEPAEVESGETEVSGEGESTTVGEGQEPQDPAAETSDAPAAETETETEAKPEPETAATAPADSPAPTSDEPEETEEEKMERLAAVQEKITKENERKLEERKEKLEQARIQSKVLNERFADWYYVIPEATYSKLRISREDLFESANAAAPNPAATGPAFPGGLPAGLQFTPPAGN